MSLSDQKSSLFGKSKTTSIQSNPHTPAQPSNVKTTIKPAAALLNLDSGLSGPAKAKKIEEAKTLSAKANAFLETSVFKWKPDHLAAAPIFENAANCYKVAGELDMAKLLYIQAATSHELIDSFAASAQSMNKAADVAKVKSLI
jgi:hypothetical protein